MARQSAGVASGLELPYVPDSILDPQDRADYLLLHFWDNMDFNDREAVSDSVMLEQTMSDFISVMNYGSPHGRHRGVMTLIASAAKGEADAYSEIMRLADLYLWEADSPFRNEAYYALFAAYDADINGKTAQRSEARLAEIMRNAPGTLAPAFSVTDVNGKTIDFRPASGDRPVVIMFYQPDCEHCEAAIDALRRDAAFDRAVGEGRIRMLAVYIGDDKALWKRHAATLPDNWEKGMDGRMTIDERQLYVVRATPSFYLVAPDGRIVLKDAGIESLMTEFGRSM